MFGGKRRDLPRCVSVTALASTRTACACRRACSKARIERSRLAHLDDLDLQAPLRRDSVEFFRPVSATTGCPGSRSLRRRKAAEQSPGAVPATCREALGPPHGHASQVAARSSQAGGEPNAQRLAHRRATIGIVLVAFLAAIAACVPS